LEEGVGYPGNISEANEARNHMNLRYDSKEKTERHKLILARGMSAKMAAHDIRTNARSNQRRALKTTIKLSRCTSVHTCAHPTLGDDRMVGTLEEIASPFCPTTR